MTRLERKYKKKLAGVYKNCINAASHQANTKRFRDNIQIKINLINSNLK